MGIVRTLKFLPSEEVLEKQGINNFSAGGNITNASVTNGHCENYKDQWQTALYYNLVSVALILIMALVIFAAMSYQCAATWRWIKDKTCRDYSDTDSTLTKQAAIRISHSLPDLQTEPLKQEYVQEHKDIKKTGIKLNTSAISMNHHLEDHLIMDNHGTRRVLRQTTLPIVPTRHQTFQRQLSHRLEMPTTIQFSICSLEHRSESSLVGLIKPELYKKDLVRQSSVESSGAEMEYCGILHFSLRYDKDVEGLVVKVFEARDLPIKDVTGSSDPYIKIYLLPDRKKKFQTKVHRKNLNPVFNETFIFSVSYEELKMRYIQFSVYDFDRFSRHDLIGHVVLKGLLESTDLQHEMEYTMNILCPPQDKVDLGELMLSLCYLPTAGRLTVTIIKGRNLKAMDITGKSDPYVKVYLLCQGKRIKKKKTSVKRNTLCPIYNEALVFDVPSENIEDVCLIIKVVDYDRIGANELMGCTAIGSNFIGVGKDHWLEMLDNPRKPVAQWYTLTELIPGHIPEGFSDELPISLSCLHSSDCASYLMAPTQEIDESFVYNPQLTLDANGDIEFLPLLLQEITPPRVEELVPIDPYTVDEVPYLPNLQRILRNATGSDNLAEVTQLKLRVIAQDVGLHRIYVHMPVLRELILDGSELTSLRDLGCGLKTLKQLRVNRCGLTSLDGIMGVENIEEFYGAFNLITDITPCAALEFIKKIDLKKNFLQDVGCLSFLSICPQLEHIILDENPNISNRFDYRELVKRYIPQLKSLDDAEYPEENPVDKPESGQGSSIGKDEGPVPISKTKQTSNCTYSVSFSPRVLTPRSDTSESSSSGSCDIKVVKNSTAEE